MASCEGYFGVTKVLMETHADIDKINKKEVGLSTDLFHLLHNFTGIMLFRK